MSAWWSYRPSDFLLFSAQTYHRLFELYNAELWPAQLFAAALGLALVWLPAKGRPAAAGRAIFLLLAACWCWVAWAFHLQRYAAINWAATWFAAGFALQGLFLLLAACIEWERAHRARRTLGLALLGFAVLVQPWLGLVLRGRPWTEAELFGMAPDPTALGTAGLLLALRPAAGTRFGQVLWWLAWPIPLLWCAIGALTQWTLAFQD
ncbi:DUF6064 family protein [Variovorax sp. JS1663]|uniref:DUF6064 family protein n=1 Tax=Variovorax sp. JS1663 TaxID=1851577 RepID=UPI000B3418D0|nr:DUF6064 family protein [Variovorax sp. JS1663]OUL99250.1 hypothetical protein A8M77_27405 [Variovorax sp. JS1663]